MNIETYDLREDCRQKGAPEPTEEMVESGQVLLGRCPFPRFYMGGGDSFVGWWTPQGRWKESTRLCGHAEWWYTSNDPEVIRQCRPDLFEKEKPMNPIKIYKPEEQDDQLFIRWGDFGGLIACDRSGQRVEFGSLVHPSGRRSHGITPEVARRAGFTRDGEGRIDADSLARVMVKLREAGEL